MVGSESSLVTLTPFRLQRHSFCQCVVMHSDGLLLLTSPPLTLEPQISVLIGNFCPFVATLSIDC